MNLPPLTPTVKKLLIAMAAIYAVLAIVELLGVDLAGWLVLHLDFLALGEPRSDSEGLRALGLLWQPLTHWLVYPPSPDGVMSLIFTSAAIYFFLSPFESRFGPRWVLELIAASVALPVLCSIVLALFVRPQFPMFGAECVALASLGAFAIYMRGARILFLFIIPMKAWMVIVLGIIFALFTAYDHEDPFILTEYFGALLAGVGYMIWRTRPPRPRTRKAKRKQSHLRLVEDDDVPRTLH